MAIIDTIIPYTLQSTDEFIVELILFTFFQKNYKECQAELKKKEIFASQRAIECYSSTIMHQWVRSCRKLRLYWTIIWLKSEYKMMPHTWPSGKRLHINNTITIYQFNESSFDKIFIISNSSQYAIKKISYAT